MTGRYARLLRAIKATIRVTPGTPEACVPPVAIAPGTTLPDDEKYSSPARKPFSSPSRITTQKC
jgi:hypothetical protein